MKTTGGDPAKAQQRLEHELKLEEHDHDDTSDEMIVDLGPEGYYAPRTPMSDIEPGQANISPHLPPPPPHHFMHGGMTPPYLGGPEGLPPSGPLLHNPMAPFYPYGDPHHFPNPMAAATAAVAALSGLAPGGAGVGGVLGGAMDATGKADEHLASGSPEPWLGEVAPPQPLQPHDQHHHF
ncbi:unnamed protein product [Meganyctiphanes norvegica]|uniref:Uncharacterized protein n=1 Tax=Meganyctiphanes norvegica TaxID=48144 RepID=A0AAV2R087_MEGNR